MDTPPVNRPLAAPNRDAPRAGRDAPRVCRRGVHSRGRPALVPRTRGCAGAGAGRVSARTRRGRERVGVLPLLRAPPLRPRHRARAADRGGDLQVVHLQHPAVRAPLACVRGLRRAAVLRGVPRPPPHRRGTPAPSPYRHAPLLLTAASQSSSFATPTCSGHSPRCFSLERGRCWRATWHTPSATFSGSPISRRTSPRRTGDSSSRLISSASSPSSSLSQPLPPRHSSTTPPFSGHCDALCTATCTPSAKAKTDEENASPRIGKGVLRKTRVPCKQ